MSTTQYVINEVFYSYQGEGARAGCPSVFVRFSGCNMQCDLKAGPKSPGGFQCDTEFASGRKLTLGELAYHIQEHIDGGIPPCGYNESELAHATDRPNNPGEKWLVLTGGEPGLQVDKEFCESFHHLGYKLAMETNGTIDVQAKTGNGIDWLTLSPKVAEHCVKVPSASEVKYVRGFGQAIPKPKTKASHKYISPSFLYGMNVPDPKALAWCKELVRDNPAWKLSIQLHKLWRVR